VIPAATRCSVEPSLLLGSLQELILILRRGCVIINGAPWRRKLVESDGLLILKDQLPLQIIVIILLDCQQ
jgi:hypothetical protein